MMMKRLYCSGVAVVLVAAVLLLARTSSVSANAQQQPAAAAGVNDVKGPTAMTFPIPLSARTVCSSPRWWIRTKSSRTRSPSREPFPTSVQFTPR